MRDLDLEDLLLVNYDADDRMFDDQLAQMTSHLSCRDACEQYMADFNVHHHCLYVFGPCTLY